MLRGVEAARHILRIRPDMARRIPALAGVTTLLAENGQRRRLVRAVTGLAVDAQAVVYLAILQDVRSGRITLRTGDIRRELVAVVAARIPHGARMAVAAPAARGVGAARQVAGHAWIAVWWVLGAVVSAVLLAAVGLSIVVRAMDAASAADASLVGSADRAVAYAASVTGALCMVVGGAIFGFSLVAIESPQDYWIRAGVIAVAVGLFFTGFTWATINLPIREKSLARAAARVDALASEIASLSGLVEPDPQQ